MKAAFPHANPASEQSRYFSLLKSFVNTGCQRYLYILQLGHLPWLRVTATCENMKRVGFASIHDDDKMMEQMQSCAV